MTETAIEERDEAIAEAVVSGRSLRSIRKEFSLTQDELDDALTRLWPVDSAARIRMIKRDVGQIERLVQAFYAKAITTGDTQSALVVIRAWERLHELLGLSAATRIELSVAASPAQAPTFDKIRQVVYRLARQPNGPPRNGDGSPSGVDQDVDRDPAAPHKAAEYRD